MTLIGGITIDAYNAITQHNEECSRLHKEQSIRESVIRSMNRRTQSPTYETLRTTTQQTKPINLMFAQEMQPRRQSSYCCYGLWWLVISLIVASIVGVVVQLFFADIAKNAVRSASVLDSGSSTPAQLTSEPPSSKHAQYTSTANISYGLMTHMEYSITTPLNICRLVMNYMVERTSHDEVLVALLRSSMDVQSSVYVQEMNNLLRAYNRCYPTGNLHSIRVQSALSCQFPMLEVRKTCQNEECKQTHDLSCRRQDLLSMHAACQNATTSRHSVWLLCMSCLVI